MFGKRLAPVILFALTFASPPLAIQALTEGYYTYTTNAAGQASITRFIQSYSGDLVITNRLGEYPVTSIGSHAFYNCSRLTSVTIPNSVITIGAGSFSSCFCLTNIAVEATNAAYVSADGVLHDKDRVSLIQCPAGRTGAYTILASVTNIADWAFAGCAGLNAITVPDSVIAIGAAAFYYCSGLTNIITSSGVTVIAASTFSNCARLKAVSIPAGTSSIGERAFYYCSGLTSVTIPVNVTNVGYSAFSSCTGLTNICVDAANSTYAGVDGALYDKNLTTIIQCPAGKTGVYAIPAEVANIGNAAFFQCSDLTAVSIPVAVTNIGEWAFEGCYGLPSIFIPDRVANIGKWAFDNCTGLTNIYVDAANSTYASVDGALYDRNLTTIIQCPAGKTGAYAIPVGVANIGYSAFFFCNLLTSITIPDSVTAIGEWAFGSCYSLTNFVIGSGVTSIGDNAFSDCTGLTSVNIPGCVTTIGNSAFSGCVSLTSIIIPDSVTAIGESAFFYCKGLTAVMMKGVPPALGGSYAFESTLATVYYLPGKTGWSETYYGRPALCWNPTIQTGTSFGFCSSNFGFTIGGTAGIPIKVEAKTNLTSGVWTSVTNAMIGSSGSLAVSDPDSATQVSRFYRIVFP